MSDTVLIAVLAAGRASRFGGGKLDAPCAGKALGRWALDAVGRARVSPGGIVAGPDVPVFAGEAVERGWSLLTNPDPARGLGTSVAVAARHAANVGAEALLLLLADMPLIEPTTIRALIDYQPLTQPVAVIHPHGAPGVPARYPAGMFDLLSQLDGDRGAGVLLRDRADLHRVTAQPDSLIDVDDAASLALADRLLRLSRS